MTSWKNTIRRLVDCASAVCAVALVVAALAGHASANVPPPTPEIDPGSLAGALALLAGGVLVLRGRIRR
ncbi:MAG TPA: hypothetical protein VNH11_35835 [Pirellulales bacterium]|nr:hypothetical protein [Pirellulales bacterium]